jgi:hypothetical protein
VTVMAGAAASSVLHTRHGNSLCTQRVGGQPSVSRHRPLSSSQPVERSPDGGNLTAPRLRTHPGDSRWKSLWKPQPARAGPALSDRALAAHEPDTGAARHCPRPSARRLPPAPAASASLPAPAAQLHLQAGKARGADRALSKRTTAGDLVRAAQCARAAGAAAAAAGLPSARIEVNIPHTSPAATPATPLPGTWAAEAPFLAPGLPQRTARLP